MHNQFVGEEHPTKVKTVKMIKVTGKNGAF
jgi:hypothetical protein